VNLSLKLDRRARLLATFVAVSTVAIGLPVIHPGQAHASTVSWVDGGDDQPCLQDDMGAALSSLAEDKWCQPIPSCHEVPQDPKINSKYYGKFIYDSASTGIWQGEAGGALYEDALPSDYYVSTSSPSPTSGTTKTPTSTSSSSSGTKSSSGSKSSTGTKSSGSKSSSSTKSSSTSKSSSSTSATSTGTTTSTSTTDDLGIDPEENVAEGAPTAPESPTLTVRGSSIVVKWKPSADVDLDGVTGYVIQLSGDNRAEVDADTTRYVFRDLPDGSYRAAVRAVNDAGESAASTPSDAVTVGTPVTSVVGTLTWTGDVSPGATVTLEGSGYAANVDLDIELHSDPVLLTTVTTDDQGSFSTDVVVPDDAPEGAHNFVVAYQGTTVSESPVTVVAAEPVVTAATDEATTTAAVTETVPPLTGLLILVALAIAGLVLLFAHFARGGSRRKTVAAGAGPSPEALTADTAAQTATFAPFQLNKPVIPAFAPAGATPPARPSSGVHRTPEAG